MTEKKKPKKILLVVDMVKGFLVPEVKDAEGNPEKCPLYLKDEKAIKTIIKNINREIKGLDRNMDHLVYVCDEHQTDDAEFIENGGQFPPHCIINTEQCELHPDLAFDPHRHQKYGKTRYDAFFWNKELEELMLVLQPDEVDIVGVCTDICIFCTALSASYRPWKIRVIKDCCMPLDKDIAEFALAYLQKYCGVEVV